MTIGAISTKLKWSSYRKAMSLGKHFFESYQDRHRAMPLEAVRYIELAYLDKWLASDPLDSDCGKLSALDVSSPYIFSVYLAEKLGAEVLKTDVNLNEARHIEQLKNDVNVRFEYADAKALSFADESFELVTSVSVIEHIYQGWDTAISEMLRVLKPGGYLYCTTHLAETQVEEWLGQNIYAEQAQYKDKTFFQYRFQRQKFSDKISHLQKAELVHFDIYKESIDGYYDFLVRALKWNWGKLNKFKRKLLNILFGLTLFQVEPNNADAGKMANLHFILKRTH